MDHGIEDPDARKALGKDPRGRLSLQAWHEGGSIIKVQDDGAGLERSKVIERARAMGYTATSTAPRQRAVPADSRARILDCV